MTLANTIIRPANMPGNATTTKPRAARFTGKPSQAKREAAAEASMLLPPEISFWIDAAPIGKPRMTQRDKWLKPRRPCVQAYFDFCDKCRCQAGAIPPASRVRSLRVVANFYDIKSGGEEYRKKPDGDNVLKAVCDALWEDDHKLGNLEIVRQRNNYKPGLAVTIVTTGPHINEKANDDAFNFTEGDELP